MAGRSLTGVGLLTKWLIIPAALAAIGYYVIGPRVGPSGATKPHQPAASTDQSADTTEPPIDVPEYKEPETTVSASPLSRRPRTSSSTRRRRRHASTDEAKPAQAAPPDQGTTTTGGTDGGTTDGGTTGTTDGGTDGGSTTGGTDGGG